MVTSGDTGTEAAAVRDLAAFPLLEALLGRRSRRFAVGGEIPDGPLAYTSRHDPMPLTELERILVLTAIGGTTGWHSAITRNATYAPHLANYSAAAGVGRSPRPPGSTPPSCSSPTTPAPTSSPRGTPAPS